MLPLVALVGRPNVGKSTLFNALTRTRQALVADQPGVTRDRHYGVCRLADRHFMLIDTGGLTGEGEGMAGLTARQAETAIVESDLVVLVVDAREGALPQDHGILKFLRRSGKPVVLAVNKTDGLDEGAALAEFADFGIEDSLPLSAAHQRGIHGLLTTVLGHLPEPTAEDAAAADDGGGRIRLAFVGRPNVGKSTLVNRLLGEERVIASEVPGTTRDSIRIDLDRDGQQYRLIDTAGIRRRGRIEQGVEKISVIKTLHAIEECQIAVVLIDGAEGLTDQDLTVIGHVLDAGRALVLAVNKWDGLPPDQRERCRYELDRRLRFVEFAEVVTISALHGSGLRELFAAVHRAHASAMRTFSTAEVTRALEVAYESFQPPLVGGRVAKLRYAHPGGSNPPTFVIHGSRIRTLPDSYKRYLENFFRKRFELVGTPVRLEFREGRNPYEGRRNELTDRQKRSRRRLLRHARK
ncbi:MAG TPA: ribosome biogenesis GTPase Der [Xanthomonadaceae bacterium]|nr:ribosome biogenesis GTPase Der [Xanthomonadaceae bacterium]